MTHSATILVVEDHPSMREGICELLGIVDLGYDLVITSADDGRAGLEAMAQTTPDLIISDIMMPHMDGYEFLHMVRENPAWVHIPIILLTAKGTEQEILEGRLSGAELYITKPFNSEELLELVKSQLDRTFQLRQQRQRELDDLQKTILQLLNHELRTPLTYVTAYTEMLADSVASYDSARNFHEYLHGVQVGCLRLTWLIDGFIKLIELRTGEAQAQIERCAEPITDLDALLAEAITASKRRSEQGTVQVRFTRPSSPPAVWGDRESLLIVFIQLLNNAIKFTSFKKQEDGRVLVTVETGDEEIRIAIADNGIGFPPHVQGRLFEMFFQYNRAQLEQQGAGIGLNIARELVRLHNGRIEVESVEGEGSTFTVVLPLYRPERHGEYAQKGGENGRIPVTILLVEDNPYLLRGLQELLELTEGRYRLTVLGATDGLEGLETLARHQPHLIISDIMMPGLDGYEFLQAVRQNPHWVHIPFIFLTAKGNLHERHRGLLSGAEEYISKPCDIDELSGLVAKQLDRYFEMQRATAQDFENLKRGVLNLLPANFQLPLSSMSQYTSQLAEHLHEAETDAELKKVLHGMRDNSVNLAHLVENFIALVELRTGEAEKAYRLHAQVLYDTGLLPYEAVRTMEERGETADALIHTTIARGLAPIYGDNTLLIESMVRLVQAGLHCYPQGKRKTVNLEVDQSAEEVFVIVRFGHPFADEDVARLAHILSHDDAEVIQLADYAPGLRIATGYVGLHNGRVETDNCHHNGFTFTICLPIYQPDH